MIHAPRAAEHLTEIKPLEIARLVAADLRARGEWINGALFSDPAWEILLDLYCAHLMWGGCSLRRLLVGSAIQQSTASRWMNALQEEGLAEEYDAQDGPEFRLTDKGFVGTSCYLAQAAGRWGYRIAD